MNDIKLDKINIQSMETMKFSKRRQFLQQIASLGTIASLSPNPLQAIALDDTTNGNGYRFLFQGDSITDGNRTRNQDWNHVMGHGYQYIVASKLWYDFPKKDFQFFNRGISGNRVPDLAARWKTEAIELKPDVLSILIGVNDLSAYLKGNAHFTSEQYEQDYRALLQQTIQQLPNVQLVIGEPFILPVANLKLRWEEYSTEMTKRQAIAKKLSVEFNAIFIPYQKAFDKAATEAPAAYWIWDGVHPMPAGHELMAREWMKQVSKKLRFIR